MKKHLLLVGLAAGEDTTLDSVEKLKTNLSRDLIDREVRVIAGALFIEEVIVNLDRGRKQAFLIVGMGIYLSQARADELKAEIRKWLPEHEVRFIIGGLTGIQVTIDVEVERVNANANGYL